MRIRRIRAIAALAAAAFALTGCTVPVTAAAEPTRTLTVFAAASLGGTFTALAAAFEAAHPGVRVSLVFDGSSGLASQIVEGAPADVFAAANLVTMQSVVDAGLADKPETFASNVLEIATAPGNPAGISPCADLADPGLVLGVGAPEVPCGAATVAIETATGVALRPASEENSVTDVLGKVTSGEADAGLVYASDVLSAGDAVTGIPFPEAEGAVGEYPIAALREGPQPALAAAFVEFILGTEAQAQLAAAGFRPAP